MLEVVFLSFKRVQLLLLHFISLHVLSESLHNANLLLTCVVSFWTIGYKSACFLEAPTGKSLDVSWSRCGRINLVSTL